MQKGGSWSLQVIPKPSKGECPTPGIEEKTASQRSSSREKSFFRESFATPSPRPFVCSVRSGAIVAAAVVLANTVAAVHLRWQACNSVKRKQTPSFALVTCACRGSAGTLQQAPWTFAGLSRIFRKTCSKIAQPTLLVCTIPNTGTRINNASINKCCASPRLQGSGVCKFSSAQDASKNPTRNLSRKKQVSFANSIADLSRRDLNKDKWSPNT